MIDREQIGKRLENWIISEGWSKSDFAAKVGIQKQSVNLYLSGKLKVENLAISLLRLGVDINWILIGQKTGEEFNAGAAEREDREIQQLRAENAAFRDALAADLVECILKRVKGGKKPAQQ